MAYNEYFDYGDCATTVNYSNYANNCSDYYGNSVYTCYEYTNAYSCSTYTNYSNHVDYNNPNTGDPFSFGGTSPDGTSAPSWSGDWSGDSLTVTYIANSINALKELRDKVQFLSEEKGQQNISTSSGLSPTSGPVDDDEFNDGNSTTPEFVEDEHYDAIRDNLENLWNNLTSDGFGLNVKNNGDIIDKSTIESLKSKIDNLAGKDLSSDYSNYFNTDEPVLEDYSETTYTAYSNYSESYYNYIEGP